MPKIFSTALFVVKAWELLQDVAKYSEGFAMWEGVEFFDPAICYLVVDREWT